jgi:hypothetical protein
MDQPFTPDEKAKSNTGSHVSGHCRVDISRSRARLAAWKAARSIDRFAPGADIRTNPTFDQSRRSRKSGACPLRPIFVASKISALTIANGSSLSEIASKFLKFCCVPLPGMVTWGTIWLSGLNVERQRRSRYQWSEELQLAQWPSPHWGTVCCLARRACNRYESRPRTKPWLRQLRSTCQLQFMHQRQLRFRSRRLRSKHQKPLTFPEHLLGRWLTTPATRRRAP